MKFPAPWLSDVFLNFCLLKESVLYLFNRSRFAARSKIILNGSFLLMSRYHSNRHQWFGWLLWLNLVRMLLSGYERYGRNENQTLHPFSCMKCTAQFMHIWNEIVSHSIQSEPHFVWPPKYFLFEQKSHRDIVSQLNEMLLYMFHDILYTIHHTMVHFAIEIWIRIGKSNRFDYAFVEMSPWQN